MYVDKLIPCIAGIEKFIKFPFGLSLFCAAKLKKKKMYVKQNITGHTKNHVC